MPQMVGGGRVRFAINPICISRQFVKKLGILCKIYLGTPLKLHSCKKSENLEGRAQKEIVKVSTNIQSR